MGRIFFTLVAALCCASMVAAKFSGIKTMQSGGKERQYFLYVPDCLTDNRPLIISCHGMNQDYNYQKEQTKWPAIADTANFVVVYPQGIDRTVWSINCSPGWDVEGMEDVNFMLDIIADVKADYNIDATRVYMSGFSLGAAFVYHVANKAADYFAAFAPISGYNILSTVTTTSRPVPIIHLHGTADNIMPYNNVRNYVKAWAQAQHCNITPEETSGSGYTCMRYKDGDCETEVVLYSITGGDHIPSSENFNISNAIWAFCQQYTNGCGKIHEAIENVQSGEKATKRIEDGMLLIEKNGKTYNAQGAEVK